MCILGFQIFGVWSPHSALSQIDASSLKKALVKNLRGQVPLHFGAIEPYIGSKSTISDLFSKINRFPKDIPRIDGFSETHGTRDNEVLVEGAKKFYHIPGWRGKSSTHFFLVDLLFLRPS